MTNDADHTGGGESGTAQPWSSAAKKAVTDQIKADMEDVARERERNYKGPERRGGGRRGGNSESSDSGASGPFR